MGELAQFVEMSFIITLKTKFNWSSRVNAANFIEKNLSNSFIKFKQRKSPRSLSKMLRWASYFQLSSRSLEMWSKTLFCVKYITSVFEYVQVFFDGKKCQQGSQTIDLDVDATDMYGPETITMRGLQSETFGYYVHIYTNGVCWDKISANVKIYQASTGGLLHNIKQPGCSESKNCRIHKKKYCSRHFELIWEAFSVHTTRRNLKIQLYLYG